MKSDETIAAVLANPVSLRFVSEPMDAEVQIDGRIFRDVGVGEFAGFYDWLRRSDGRLIGVRTWFAKDSKLRNLQKQFSTCRAVDFEDNCFKIFFSDARQFSPENSDDQEFGRHRIASSSDGVLLVTYDVSMLAEGNIKDLIETADHQTVR